MMTSCSSLAVLLTILVLGGALVEAAGRPLESWPHTTRLDNREDVGEVEDERATISSLVHNYVSSLDPEKIKQYAASLEEGTLGQHSSEFCQDATLMCDSNIAIADPNMGISQDAHEDDKMFQESGKVVNDDQPLSFDEKDIVKGQVIVFPESLHDPSYSSPSFLPHSLAEKMPFSSEKMHELLDTLHISHNSNLATMMSRTISRCKLTKEKSSKEIMLSKEKEIKGKDIIWKEKKGKEIEFSKEKRSNDKEIKVKKIKGKEIKEKEKSSKEKEIHENDVVLFKEKERKGEKIKKKEIEVSEEKSSKEKEMEMNEIESSKEIKRKYIKREEHKEKEMKGKEYKEKKSELSKEKSNKETKIDWNKEEEIKGKEKNKGKEIKDKEFKEKVIKEKEIEFSKEKSSKEEIKKKETEWNKDKFIQGKMIKEKDIKEKEIMEKETNLSREKEFIEKDIKGNDNDLVKRKEVKKKEIKEKETELTEEKSSNEKVIKEKEIEVRKEKSSKETLKCVISLEGMTNFVKKSLPAEKHIKALETSSSSKLVEGDHKEVHWKVLDVKKHEKAVVCKKEVFPFAVFQCHKISKTKGTRIYHIELEGKDGVHRKEVVACDDKKKSHDVQHRKTITPSKLKESCRWITHSLIWVPTI